MDDNTHDSAPLESANVPSSGAQLRGSYTLVFVTAQWCDPGTAMVPIFEETIRDFARLHTDLTLEGIVIDIDDEETNQQLGLPLQVSGDILDSINYVPSLILLHGSRELLRLVGQLPKLVIRERVRQVIEADNGRP